MEPDEIWMANWNGAQNTSDGYVPAQDWAAHQRLHQYQGAHNETYGGTTINIDGDYLDSATAAAGTGSGSFATPAAAPAPSLAVTAGPDGGSRSRRRGPTPAASPSGRSSAASSPSSLTWMGPTVHADKVPIVDHRRVPLLRRRRATTHGPAARHLRRSHHAIARGDLRPGRIRSSPRPGRRPGRLLRHAGLRGDDDGVDRPLHAGQHRCRSSSRGQAASPSSSSHQAAQKMLTRAVHHQLSVRVKVSDAAGSAVSRVMKLNSFATTNPSPLRRLSQSSQLRLIGTADFVSNGWVGGVLAECVGPPPARRRPR